MSDTTRLIVNADDFGQSDDINRGVAQACREGILTSASLMVTGPTVEGAVRLAKAEPALAVGLHVVLTGARPVRSVIEIPSLVNGAGRLADNPAQLASARTTEVLDEMRAQLRRFRELMGRFPTHLDSHTAVHKLRPVFDAFITIAWETGLPIRAVTPAMRLQLRYEGLGTTDEFVDAFKGEKASVERLTRLLGQLKPGTTELVSRPSTSGPAGSQELSVLCEQRVKDAIRSGGIQLIHHGHR
jgi:chitin disaccharide deacetylase